MRLGRSATAYHPGWGLLWVMLAVGVGQSPAIAQATLQAQIIQPFTSAISGSRQSPSAANYTLLYVNPELGHDPSGTGDLSAPFQTITRALQIAQPGTVIVLAPGIYSIESGETFPLRLKGGVTIQGEPRSGGRNIVIRGGGSFNSPTMARQNATLVAADQSGLAGVTVTNPNPDGSGLWIESVSPVVLDNTFRGSTHDGVMVVGQSRAVIRHNYFAENGANGLSLLGMSQADVRDNVFDNTGWGIRVADSAAPVLIGNRVLRNRDGIVVQDNARPILRNNLVEANEQDGLVAIAQAQPDLGTAGQPGGNLFRNNGRLDINQATAASSPTLVAYGDPLTQPSSGTKTESSSASLSPAIAPTPPVASPLSPTPPSSMEASGFITAHRIVPSATSSSLSAAAFPVPSLLQQAAAPESRSVAPAAPPAREPVPNVEPPTPPTAEEPPAPDPIAEAAEAVPVPIPIEPPQPLAVAPEPPRAPEETSAAEPIAEPVNVEATIANATPDRSPPVPEAIAELPAVPESIPESVPEAVSESASRALASLEPASDATAIALENLPARSEAPVETAIPIPVEPPAAESPVPEEPTRRLALARPMPTADSAPRAVEPAPIEIPVQMPNEPAAQADPVEASAAEPSPRSDGAVSDLLTRFRDRRTQAQSPASRPSRTPSLTPSSLARTTAESRAEPDGAISIPVEPPPNAAARPTAGSLIRARRDRPAPRQTVALQRQPSLPTSTATAPISIPVPQPERSAAPSSTIESPEFDDAQTALRSPLPGDVLLVPSAPIPLGSGGGGLPTVSVPRTVASRSAEGPPPPPSRANALGLQYRVIVETPNERDQNRVRSLVPDAFRTRYNGQVMMQAGAYRDRAEADAMLRLLEDNGFTVVLTEPN